MGRIRIWEEKPLKRRAFETFSGGPDQLVSPVSIDMEAFSVQQEFRGLCFFS